MTARGGPFAVRLDGETADRLLARRIAPDDAPPGYGDVARMVLAAAASPTASELRHVDDAVTAALHALARTPLPRGRRSGLARARVVGLVVVGTLLATSGLAVAGVLPPPAQRVVAEVLSKVGITIPSPDDPKPIGRERPAGAAVDRPTADAPAVTERSEVSATAFGRAVDRPGGGDTRPSPPGQGDRPPHGHGNGPPPGHGSDSPPGQGNGSPPGQGNGSPRGHGNAQPPGQGNGPPPGQGNGPPPGQGNGSPPGQGNAQPPGQGNGPPPGQGNGPPPGQGNGRPG